jgi:hypothetical protein
MVVMPGGASFLQQWWHLKRWDINFKQLLNNTSGVQFSDSIGRITQLRQHRIGMLAECRYRIHPCIKPIG